MLFVAAMVNPVHVTTLLFAVPPLLIFVMLEKPAGTTSSIATPVAVLGPSLVTRIVKMIVSPTTGVALSTVLFSRRSADRGVDGDAVGIGGCAIRGGGGDVGDGAIVDIGLGDDIVDRGADDDFANIEIAVAIADGGDGGTGGRGFVIADGDGTGESDIASILDPIAVVDGVTDRVVVVGSRGLDQRKRGVLCGVDSDAIGIGGCAIRGGGGDVG